MFFTFNEKLIFFCFVTVIHNIFRKNCGLWFPFLSNNSSFIKQMQFFFLDRFMYVGKVKCWGFSITSRVYLKLLSAGSPNNLKVEFGL